MTDPISIDRRDASAIILDTLGRMHTVVFTLVLLAPQGELRDSLEQQLQVVGSNMRELERRL